MTKQSFWLLPMLLILLLGFLSNTHSVDPVYCSPQAMAYDDDSHQLYVADVTGEQVLCFDVHTKTVEATIPINGTVGSLILDHHHRLWVSTQEVQGQLIAIDIQKNTIIEELNIGHMPNAMALAVDQLLVANTFTNNVSIINTENVNQVRRISHASRFPNRIEVKGNCLYVMDLIPHGPADDLSVASQVKVYDILDGHLLKSISLPSGSNAIKGSCLSKDGRYLYMTHLVGRFYFPAKTVKKGWMNTNALSIIDLEEHKLWATVLLDYPNRGSANPWGITSSYDGGELAIALSGTDELLLIDREAMHRLIADKYEHYSEAIALEDMSNDLSFLTSVKRRVPLHACKGVRDVVATAEGYWVSAYYTADLIQVNDKTAEVISLYENEHSLERQGEIYFNDATYCLQNWQSCTSCHVDGGRVDGLNWDLLNDGIGNPKNTKSLLYAHHTPPSMALGIRKDANTSVKAGIKHSLFKKNVDDAVAEAIDAYVQSLEALQSPYVKPNGKLMTSAKRGKKVFVKKGCAHCHSGKYYTNGQRYVFDIATGADTLKAFDTPGLHELWRTAPYLYDGRAVSLEDVLTTYRGNHFIEELSERELADLVLYLKSL